MALKLYNTLTRAEEIFRPIDRSNVRMYVCGPTVYDFAHIGNARPVIVFDVLFRLLRHIFGEAHVTYVRNITDVDDKINARAARDYPELPLNEAIAKVTELTNAQFQEDVKALNCLPPTHQPRATENIAQMIDIIERLIARGHAYEAEGHVLFHVPSDKNYGSLSRRSLDEMEAGARVEVAPYKRDPMDFVLWKPSSANEPGWESPWGRGRPGWHIECSAMSWRYLSERFDIHGGGIDLVFPHHENERAQSCCAFGTEVMANVWMHNGFLQVEGQKMSKSLGNFVTIRELLSDWAGYAWPGEAVRFAMLQSHYREPIDWTGKALDEAHKILWRWAGEVEAIAPAHTVPQAVLDALCDDLNTPQAIAAMHGLYRERQFAELKAALLLLGFTGTREALKRVRSGDADEGGGAEVKASEAEIRSLIDQRLQARAAKNWAEADRIRDQLVALGVVIKDGKDPASGAAITTWEWAR